MNVHNHTYVTLTILVCLVAPTIFSGCSTNKQDRWPIENHDSETLSRSNYMKFLKHAPELMPSERQHLERRSELATNFAIREAQNNFRVTVRSIAPLMRLSGDENVDMARTHRMLLVADDIPEGKMFLDVYEVRVGPASNLAVVEPAKAASKLVVTDAEFFEELLRRRRGEQRTVAATFTTWDQLVNSMSTEIDATIVKLGQNQATYAADVDARRQDRDRLTNGKPALLKALREAETDLDLKRQAYSNISQEGEAKTAAKNAVVEAEKVVKTATDAIVADAINLTDARSAQTVLDRAEKRKAETDDALRQWREIRRNPEAFKAVNVGMLKMIELLESELARIQEYAKDAGEGYSMRSAVSVSFRARSLQDLDQVTIEVRRLVGTGHEGPTEIHLVTMDESLSSVLDELIALSSGITRRMTPGHGSNGPPAPSEEDKNGLRKQAHSIQKQIEAFENIWIKYKDSAFGRDTQPYHDLLVDNRFLTLVANDRIVPQTEQMRTINNALFPLRETIKEYRRDSFNRIAQGNVAVFRYNVLRGLARTTAFLLADDNAELLFGKRFADTFHIAQITITNTDDKPIIVNETTMRMIVRMTTLAPYLNDLEEGQKVASGKYVRHTFWATYQPLDIGAVRRMMRQSNEESWQRVTSRMLDLAGVGVGVASAFVSSIDFARGAALFNGTISPVLKDQLNADLLRYEENLESAVLDKDREIQPGDSNTRYVFLPKGPIFGTFAFDSDTADNLPFKGAQQGSRDFGRTALIPAYIYDIRREEVYIEGKRILKSDKLTPTLP